MKHASKLFTGIITAAAIAVIGVGDVSIITDAEAKGYSSRSSSSRSFSRSSSRSSKSSSMFSSWKSKKSSKPANNFRKPVSKAKTAKTAKTTNKPPTFKSTTKKSSAAGFSKTKTRPTSIKSGKQTQQAKAALTAQRSKFKKPSTQSKVSTNSTRSTYSSNPTYSRAASYDRGTYYNRRNSYYNGVGYHTPRYVYGASSSYGMWDTIFLYSMLSNMSNASSFGYHHRNDADYLKWRREADILANDNAELRKQLTAMDAGSSKMSGTIDPNYLPNGVDADIAMSKEVRDAQIPQFNICVAGKSGAYHKIANRILNTNQNLVAFNPVITSGTSEILSKISDGSCDGGFAQSDGYWNYVETEQTANLPFERVFSPFKESIHLVCNSKGPSSVDDLTSDNKLWFPKNSGAAVTWKNFIAEDSSYGEAKTVLNTPSMVVASYEEAQLKLSNDSDACMLFVGAPGSTLFMARMDAGAKNQNLVLIDVDDSDFNDTTDPAGKDVYNFTELDVKTYPTLLREGGCYGLCEGAVDTLQVNADFLVSNDWKSQYNKVYPEMAATLIGMQPIIAKAVKQ